MKHLLLLLLFPVFISAQVTDSIRYVEFESVGPLDEYDSIAWSNGNRLRHEFELKGPNPIKCALTVKDSGHVILTQLNKGSWKTLDTIHYVVFPDVTPSFMITDFDRDGNEDFMYWSHTNINGNMWITIFLNHPDRQQLMLLKTTPDDADIWCAPEYNPKTKIISTTSVSGIYGRSAESTYRLENKLAIPIYKEEIDNTQMSSLTGKGGVTNIYDGKKGKWKLRRRIKS